VIGSLPEGVAAEEHPAIAVPPSAPGTSRGGPALLGHAAHRQWASALQHDDGVRIGAEDGGDQLRLPEEPLGGRTLAFEVSEVPAKTTATSASRAAATACALLESGFRQPSCTIAPPPFRSTRAAP
jgi:hypothetical protein